MSAIISETATSIPFGSKLQRNNHSLNDNHRLDGNARQGLAKRNGGRLFVGSGMDG